MTADFADTYREHVAPIWRYVRARLPSDADAEDVTSEVFAQAMRSWDRFDAGRGSVGGWLVGIARHVVADWWHRRGREVPVEDIAVDHTADGTVLSIRPSGTEPKIKYYIGVTYKRGTDPACDNPEQLLRDRIQAIREQLSI